MAKGNTTAAKADKPKRTVLTPAERIAKAEAELARVREKEQAKINKAAERMVAERAKHLAKINELTDKVNKIDAELERIGYSEAAADADATEEDEAAQAVES